MAHCWVMGTGVVHEGCPLEMEPIDLISRHKHVWHPLFHCHVAFLVGAWRGGELCQNATQWMKDVGEGYISMILKVELRMTMSVDVGEWWYLLVNTCDCGWLQVVSVIACKWSQQITIDPLGVDSSLKTPMTCVGDYELKPPIYKNFMSKNERIVLIVG